MAGRIGSTTDLVSTATKTTRLFATLKRQPSDVRLAASVELVALAANALQSRSESGVLNADALRRFDEEYDAWTDYWAPLVSVASEESGGEDPIAWSLFDPYACFTRLTVRGFAFNKWRADRRAHLAALRRGDFEPNEEGATQTPLATLEPEDRDSIAKAVEVVEEMMLAVSTQGRGVRSNFGLRKDEKLPWRGDGGALVPDPDVVKTLKWASDSLTCVVSKVGDCPCLGRADADGTLTTQMFSYPLIFLAKLANDGLLRPDLTVIPAGTSLLPPTPMSHEDKLCRLFQLGADLLDAIAPNPSHPAVRQAAFLRKVWDAGISGRRAITSAPTSPRFRPSSGGSDVPPLLPHDLSHRLQQAEAERDLQQQAPAPPTFPLPSTAAPPARPLATSQPTPARVAGAYQDVALSSSYVPTPSATPSISHTPASYPSHRVMQAAGMLDGHISHLAVQDPFSALLNELNPSFSGDDPFFGLDSGLDWPVLDGGGQSNGFSGMHF